MLKWSWPKLEMQLEKLNKQPLKLNNRSTGIEDEAKETYNVILCKFYTEIQFVYTTSLPIQGHLETHSSVKNRACFSHNKKQTIESLMDKLLIVRGSAHVSINNGRIELSPLFESRGKGAHFVVHTYIYFNSESLFARRC